MYARCERPAVGSAHSGNKTFRFAGTLAGATGLEPATSGVTGRSWLLRAERGQAGIPGNSRTFKRWPCGDRRVRAGVPGRLLPDQRGMTRCLPGERQRPFARRPRASPIDPLVSMRSDRQPVAIHGNGFGLVWDVPRAFRFATGCHCPRLGGNPQRLPPHVDDRDQVCAPSRRRDSPTAERREIKEAWIEGTGGVAARPDVCAESTSRTVGPASGDARSAARREPTKFGADPAVLLDECLAGTTIRDRDKRCSFGQVDCNARGAEVEGWTSRDRMRRRLRYRTRLRSRRAAACGLRRENDEHGTHQHHAGSEFRHRPRLRRCAAPVSQNDADGYGTRVGIP
jgi:hypothetical protein